MLPSGNDAAIALAEWGGLKLKQYSNSAKAIRPMRHLCVKKFVKKMNQLAEEIGLKSTQWNNPHGLSDKQNKSTAYDMAQLCRKAFKSDLFRKIVATQSYKSTKMTSDS